MGKSSIVWCSISPTSGSYRPTLFPCQMLSAAPPPHCNPHMYQQTVADRQVREERSAMKYPSEVESLQRFGDGTELGSVLADLSPVSAKYLGNQGPIQVQQALKHPTQTNEVANGSIMSPWRWTTFGRTLSVQWRLKQTWIEL